MMVNCSTLAATLLWAVMPRASGTRNRAESALTRSSFRATHPRNRFDEVRRNPATLWPGSIKTARVTTPTNVMDSEENDKSSFEVPMDSLTHLSAEQSTSPMEVA